MIPAGGGVMADTFADLRDASNPFNVAGISDEDRSLMQYLRDAKAATRVDVVVTCTTDHAAGATRHLQRGTNGLGLAIDCRKRTRGLDIHKAVFDLFVPIETQLYELIYAGASYNVKSGRRVAPYAVSSHRDHVHVAVNRGVFVRWPQPTPVPAPVIITKEDDMAVIVTKTTGESWVTDLVSKRPVKGPAHFDELYRAGLRGIEPMLSDEHIDAIPLAPGA
jgi:hypothetical protein